MIQTKHVRNALVYYDDRYPNRWLKAIGQNVVDWELPVALPEDDATTLPTSMVVTLVNGSTALSSATAGDRMVLTTDTAEYDGVNAQAHGAPFVIGSGRPLYFGTRVAFQNGVGKGDYLVGMCEVDTTLLAAASAHAVAVTDDGVYFYQLQGSTTATFANEIGGVAGTIATGVTTGSGAYHDFEIYVDELNVLYAYVDGVEIGSVASGLADQALTPSFNIKAGDDGAEIMYVTWARAIQIR